MQSRGCRRRKAAKKVDAMGFLLVDKSCTICKNQRKCPFESSSRMVLLVENNTYLLRLVFGVAH